MQASGSQPLLAADSGDSPKKFPGAPPPRAGPLAAARRPPRPTARAAARHPRAARQPAPLPLTPPDAGENLSTWQKIIPLGFMFFCILFNYTILRDTKVCFPFHRR